MIRVANKLLKQHGLPHGYTPFLMALWEQDGQTQVALRKKIGIEQPTAVRTLDRMERDGLITRKNDPTDRRAVNICLTKAATQLQTEIMACSTVLNKKALKQFSANEKKQLQQLLTKLICNLQTEID
ncbi:MAG: MarR family transcriptional regulator [Gammaproteobacteria bacterium]